MTEPGPPWLLGDGVRVNMRQSSLPFAVAFILVALAALGGACSNTSTPTSPSTSAPFSKTDLLVGTGDEAVSGKTLSVDYTGWIWDPAKPEQKGLQFDTSAGRGAFSFVVGAGNVIKGWDEGLIGMKVGGIRRLVIPPSMGYGNTRTAAIPPNSTLVFDVTLRSVQ